MTVETSARTAPAELVAPSPDAAPAVYNKHVTDLVAWAQQAHAAKQFAEAVVNTNFCPEAYRRKPDEAAAAILAGAELGFSPMAALRTFDNIQGVASPKAITQRAVVQSHGHAIWPVEQSATRVVMRGRRRDSEQVHESVWTIERAELAGFIKKNPNYKTQPESMLVARATSEVARLVASDALLGIPYSSEELQDESALLAPHPDSAQGALPAPRAAQRGGTTMGTRAIAGAPTEDAAVTRSQLKRISEAFKAAQVTDKKVIAEIVNKLADTPVEKATELTEAGAEAVLGRLEQLGPGGIARAANPEPVPDDDTAEDTDTASEGDDTSDDGEVVEDEPAWPETTPPGGKK